MNPLPGPNRAWNAPDEMGEVGTHEFLVPADTALDSFRRVVPVDGLLHNGYLDNDLDS